MPPDPASSDRPSPTRWPLHGKLVALAATAWLALEHLRVAIAAEIALDEYQYAHGGWLLAHGERIYRDFFEHHLPLLHQLLGLVWRMLDDDPTHVLTLRLAFLPVFALAIAAGTVLNHREDGVLAAWATPPLLLMIPALSGMAIQLRPDVLGAALFLLALALLSGPRAAPGTRSFLAGLAAGAALWATLKLAVVGLVFLAALVADLASGRRDSEDPRLLGRPLAFVGGAAAFLGPALLWILATSGPAAFWRWAVAFNLRHQEVYPGFGWTRNLLQILDRSPWLFVLGAVGILSTVRRLRRSGDGAADSGDLLLLGAFATTAASVAWQQAPYLYSFVPWLLVTGIFAARGLAAVGERLRPRASDRDPLRIFLVVLVALLVLGELRQSLDGLGKLRARTNDGQLATLARLGEMTAPDEPVFHFWGGQVARPSPHFFHFLEAATKQLEAERIRRELVPSLVEKGVVVYSHHPPLFDRLPEELRRYLRASFLPMDRHLWVYGRRYEVTAGAAEGVFPAVRDGRYFVSPPNALGDGQRLLLDGRELGAPIVRLERGSYRVRYEGRSDEIFLVWLPRDGKPFTPRPELKPADAG